MVALEEKIQEVSTFYPDLTVIAEAINNLIFAERQLNSITSNITQKEKTTETLAENVQSKQAKQAVDLDLKLEDVAQETLSDKETENLLPWVNYNSLQTNLEEAYAQVPTWYKHLFSYTLGKENDLETEDYSLSSLASASGEMMSDLEAQKTTEEVVFQSITHVDEMDFETKQKFNSWQMFNKPLLFLYDSTSLIRSADVNYTLNY